MDATITTPKLVTKKKRRAKKRAKVKAQPVKVALATVTSASDEEIATKAAMEVLEEMLEPQEPQWASTPVHTPKAPQETFATIPLIPYFTTAWQTCANAFAGNVSCVIALRVNPERTALAYWRKAIKTLRDCRDHQNRKLVGEGKPPIRVRLVGYLISGQSTSPREQRQFYIDNLGINEFWQDDDRETIVAGHWGDENLRMPEQRRKGTNAAIGFSTAKFWRDEWAKAALWPYALLTEDPSLCRPPMYWREWLKSLLTR